MNCGADNIGFIFDLLKVNTTIQELDLRGNLLQSKHILTLSNSILNKENCTLKKLHLSSIDEWNIEMVNKICF